MWADIFCYVWYLSWKSKINSGCVNVSHMMDRATKSGHPNYPSPRLHQHTPTCSSPVNHSNHPTQPIPPLPFPFPKSQLINQPADDGNPPQKGPPTQPPTRILSCSHPAHQSTTPDPTVIATPPVDVLASVGLSLSGRQAPRPGFVCSPCKGGGGLRGPVAAFMPDKCGRRGGG